MACFKIPSETTLRLRFAARSALIACVLFVVTSTGGSAQQIDQAVGDLTNQILDSLQAEGKTKVAVVEFTDLSGEVTPLGRLVAEELISQVFTSGGDRIQLVERSKLEEVLGEQRLGIKGLLEKRNIETFGRILGVEAILTGTIGLLADRVRINARLIAVPSAELFATAATYMSRVGLDESYFAREATGGSTGGPPSESRPGPVATKDYKGITYELLKCTQATRLINCQLVLTNNGADRSYWLGVNWDGGTYFYDQRGHQFFVSRVRLADVEVESGGARKFLITEIPTEAEIFFEGVPSSIDFIKILHLRTSDGEIQYRDVHFSKE